MHFLGIDFGWENKPSGMAALEWTGDSLHLLKLDRLAEIAEILNWIDEYATRDTVIGIDAPIVISNETGMREADKLAHSRYGRYHAGAYPASRARSFWKRTTQLCEALVTRGFRHGDEMLARTAGRHQIEVHPHAAVVQLFALDRIVKYKRGTVAERAAELGRLRKLMLEHFPRLTPRLALPELPAIPESGVALKQLEDQMDAITSAYVAAHWWYWGVERNEVLGNASTGYIIVPKRETWFSTLADLRENYSRSGLLEPEVSSDPILQFERWLADARSAAMKEPNAMALATVSPTGQPSARMVLLKGLDRGGFVFYTNLESRKAQELAANPHAALVFYWAELERQVRVTGIVKTVDRAAAERYFHSRPRGSQLGAWASHQSQVVSSREVIEASMAEAESRYAGGSIPLPAFWGGYRLEPLEFEFWQGRPNRLHDRLKYSKQKHNWRIERLSP